MNEVKAKYIFDELTLGDVLEIVKKKVGALIVHQDDLTWEHVHFNWPNKGKLKLYDGDEANDDQVALWIFSLKEKVRVGGNMIYFKKEDLALHNTALELLQTRPINLTKILQKI